METLRRIRFVWATLCLLIGLVFTVLMLYARMPDYAVLTAVAGCALSLPLYSRMGWFGKLSTVWLVGVGALALLTPRGQGVALALVAGSWIAASVVAWVLAGLTRGRASN